MTRPGMCTLCRADAGHDLVPCPVCGRNFQHVPGLRTHLGSAHGMTPGRRAHTLAIDVARAGVRGWPTEDLRARFSEVYRLEIP